MHHPPSDGGPVRWLLLGWLVLTMLLILLVAFGLVDTYATLRLETAGGAALGFNPARLEARAPVLADLIRSRWIFLLYLASNLLVLVVVSSWYRRAHAPTPEG